MADSSQTDSSQADSSQETRRRGTSARGEASEGIDTFPADFDRLIHERVRLGILSALAAGGRLSFTDLKELLETSDGNLSVHARKLEEAGYLECLKSFEGRMPKTEYRLTRAGREALSDYLDQMEEIIHMARS